MKINEVLVEAPLMGYKTLSDKPNSPRGAPTEISDNPEDFNKRSSSFKDKRDRHMVSSTPMIKRIHKKFENTDYDFYFYMVNTKEAKDFFEVGLVDRAWLEKNMPAVEPHIEDHDDGITIIFTNNSGDQKVIMTPWIMAHRIAHSMARFKKYPHRHIQSYSSAESDLNREIADILNTHYKANVHTKDIPNSPIARKFFEAIGTFKSAREGKLRNSFEFLNEVFAQYLLTGSIKFNSAPKSIKVTQNRTSRHYMFSGDSPDDYEDVNYTLDSLSRTLEYWVDSMLGESQNRIFVM